MSATTTLSGKRTSNKKNNFRNATNVNSAQYKLFVKYKPDYSKAHQINHPDGIKSYYGFLTKSDGGLETLRRNIIQGRKGQYYVAILYDNQTGNEIERWIDGK